jgi:hypothetical protein
MRYENIIQIYWSKGFFFGGSLYYFDRSLKDIVDLMPGFDKKLYLLLKNRFELTVRLGLRYVLIPDYEFTYNKKIVVPLNVILSQINSVNNKHYELSRLNIIRLYLIKSYRGRSHALGKPVRGQRTWSNAWSSFYTNKILRTFISETRNQLKNKKVLKKINYKMKDKKYTKKGKKKKSSSPKKVIWF